MTALALASCGGSSGNEAPSATEVKACLEKQGLAVTGPLKPSPADKDAPEKGELIVRNGTFIAFYESTERADKFEGVVRAGAKQLRGAVTRHGPITVIYTKQPGLAPTRGVRNPRVEGCVE